MTNNPTKIRCRPEHFTRRKVINRRHRPLKRGCITTTVTNHTFRDTRSARSIKDIKRVGRFNRNAWVRRRFLISPRPVYIGIRVKQIRMNFTLENNGFFNLMRGNFACRVQKWLIFNQTTGFDANRCRHDKFWCCVVNTFRKLGCGKATENH